MVWPKLTSKRFFSPNNKVTGPNWCLGDDTCAAPTLKDFDTPPTLLQSLKVVSHFPTHSITRRFHQSFLNFLESLGKRGKSWYQLAPVDHAEARVDNVIRHYSSVPNIACSRLLWPPLTSSGLHEVSVAMILAFALVVYAKSVPEPNTSAQLKFVIVGEIPMV